MMKIRNLLTAGVAALAIGTAVPALAEGQIAVGMQTQVDRHGDRHHNNTRYYNNRWDNHQNRYESRRGTTIEISPYGVSSSWQRSPYWNNHRYRVGRSTSVILSLPFGNLAAYSGGCGYNRVRMVMNDFNEGGPVVIQRNYGSGFYYGEPLTGYRISPASSTCVPSRDVRLNRVSLIHDVNNNGIFDPQDGIGRITYGYASGLGYGGSRVVNVTFDYNNGFNYGY